MQKTIKIQMTNLSKIEIKIPTIKLEFLGVFGFSIPIPKLDTPEMTVTLTPPT